MSRRETPFYQALRDAGHLLKTNEDGDVDCWVVDYEFHNGPGCVLCDESWCEHCAGRGFATIRPCPNAALEGEFVNVTNQKHLEQEKGE